MGKSNDDLIEAEEDDLEFEAFVRELRPDMSAAEYVYFDADIPRSEPMINEHEVEWLQRLQDYINGVSFLESLAMVEKIKKCSFLDDNSQMMLSTLTRKFEDL